MSTRSVSSNTPAYRYRLVRYRTRVCRCNKEAFIFVTKSNDNGNEGCLFVRCIDRVCGFIKPFEPEVFEGYQGSSRGGYEEGGSSSRGVVGISDLKKLEKFMKALEAKQSKMQKQELVFMCFIAAVVAFCLITGRI